MRRYKVALPYTTTIHGHLYFRKSYPTHLVQAGLLPKYFKKRLKSDPTDQVSISTEIAECHIEWELRVSHHEGSDLELAKAVNLQKKAHDYLKIRSLKAGLGSAYLDEKGIDPFDLFPEYTKVWTEAGVLQVPEHTLMTPAAEVEKLASDLLINEAAKPLHLLSDVWRLYTEARPEKSQRQITKESGFWNKFIEYGGGDTEVTEENVRTYIRTFNKRRVSEIKGSSVTRQLTTVMSAIKEYVEEHDLDIDVHRPKLPRNADRTKNSKNPLSYTEQFKLIELLPSLEPWEELYCLLSLQSGMHPSESKSLTIDSFDFDKEPYVFILNEGGGKSDFRMRILSMVYQPEKIRHLVQNTDALLDIASKSAESIGAAIKKVLLKVQKGSSAYTLRHTLRHNSQSAGLGGSIEANLGGWSSGTSKVSAHQFRYGRGGKDTEERIQALANQSRMMLAHLIEADTK